jgi:hypothetical protein
LVGGCGRQKAEDLDHNLLEVEMRRTGAVAVEAAAGKIVAAGYCSEWVEVVDLS